MKKVCSFLPPREKSVCVWFIKKDNFSHHSWRAFREVVLLRREEGVDLSR